MALSLADLSPEIRLLLACCHVRLDAAQQANLVASARAVTDWASVPPLAREYMVSALAHHHLKAHAAEIVPTDVMQRLERQRQRAVQHNLLLAAELKRLVRDWLEPLAIPYLAFKGPVLAQAFYGDIGLRQSRDLDVLVAASRLHELVVRLLAAGYQPLRSSESIRPAQLAACCYFLKDISLRSPTGIIIELHKELSNIKSVYPVAPKWLLANALEQDLAGQMIRVMPPVEEALYLCHHHGTHQWSRLHWLADLNVLLGRHPDALDVIGRRAVALGMETLWTSSVYLQEFLQGRTADSHPSSMRAEGMVAAVMRIFMGSLEKPEVRALVSRRSLWRRTHYLIAEEVMAWRSHYGWGDRLKCLTYALRPNMDDLLWLDLPRPLYGLYWLIRPLRWLWEMRRRELSAAHDHA